MIDVVIENTVKNEQGETVEGSLLFTWEDSLWGNDFDFDASSRIKFCVGARCVETSDPQLHVSSFADDQVRIAVKVVGVYAGLNMRFSYTVTGTYNDGLNSNYVYKGQSDYKINNFTASGNTAGILKKPLWFAAKYGGFVDLDGDGTPRYSVNGISDDREWDNWNNTTGSIGSDGLPDNYYFARNPALLGAQLGQVLQDIASRVSSATNAALFSNNQAGTGVLYQALFQPAKEYSGKTVTWGGLLHALFVDSKGLLREDTNGNDQLDGYDQDKIVELIFDPNSNQTLLQRYTTSDDGVTKTATGSLSPLAELNTLWDARDQLSQVSNLIDQRHYNSIASSGRHMLTWLDADNDGEVDTGETLQLTSDTFVGAEGYLDVNAADAAGLINYIRGVETPGMRNRTIDYNGDGTDEVWRLGDIVHSTPHLVSKPVSRFDALYSDATYTGFLEKYSNRRHVLYVGANDGLIHAFNGGFWDGATHGYRETGDNAETAHPLGSELWSYAPMNLLPHLKWLKETDYPHVYYMDGEPVTFDANIFDADDPDYPGGWGTVLVLGMRLGGGSFDITVNNESKTMRSAYIVLDITNPEEPPKLLAEITHPELGFTTSRPALVKRRVAEKNNDGEDDWSKAPVTNDWYLVFGSGPAGKGEKGIRQALENGSSNQNLKLFVYDLKARSLVSGMSPLDSGVSAAYAGNISAVDWDNDYQDDAVYFGATETGGSTLGGKLMRLQLSTAVESSSLTTLLDTQKPVSAAPTFLKDKQDYWLFFGSGRLLTSADNRDSQQQAFYGVKEPVNSSKALTYGLISESSLVDTTDVRVYSSGSIEKETINGNVPFMVDGVRLSNFSGLQKIISTKAGWKVTLSGDGVNPAGRNITSATRLFSFMLFTEYAPSADSCRVDGSSSLYALYYQTGTASPDLVLAYQDLGEDIPYQLSVKKVGLGLGYASSPVVHHGSGGKRTAVTQGAGGSISHQQLNYNFDSSGRMSWRQIFNIPWKAE